MTENYIFEIAVLTLDLNHHFNVLQVTSRHFKSVAYLANKKRRTNKKKTTKSKTKNIVNELIEFRVFKVIISLFNLVRSILRTLKKNLVIPHITSPAQAICTITEEMCKTKKKPSSYLIFNSPELLYK